MNLIVGLGNPGKKYKNTRHNIGFKIIEALKKEVSKDKVILLKPQTFMNNSGKPVKKLINKYKIPISNLIVIHDDIDISFGNIKISYGASSAGHKGVQSIIDELNSKDFTRIRVGITPQANIKPQDLENYVLEKFNKQEKNKLKQIIKQATELIKHKLKTDF